MPRDHLAESHADDDHTTLVDVTASDDLAAELDVEFSGDLFVHHE